MNLEDIKQREQENRPQLQAENTGYHSKQVNGLKIYKTKETEEDSR